MVEFQPHKLSLRRTYNDDLSILSLVTERNLTLNNVENRVLFSLNEFLNHGCFTNDSEISVVVQYWHICSSFPPYKKTRGHLNSHMSQECPLKISNYQTELQKQMNLTTRHDFLSVQFNDYFCFVCEKNNLIYKVNTQECYNA